MALWVAALVMAALTMAAYCPAGVPAEVDIRAMPASAHDGRVLALDVNGATAEELEELPGIGPALADRIIAARQIRPLEGPEDLLAVKGIGPAIYKDIEPYITFHADEMQGKEKDS